MLNLVENTNFKQFCINVFPIWGIYVIHEWQLESPEKYRNKLKKKENPRHISWLKINIKAKHSEEGQVSPDLQNTLITKVKNSWKF
jgi:hypothetical protein